MLNLLIQLKRKKRTDFLQEGIGEGNKKLTGSMEVAGSGRSEWLLLRGAGGHGLQQHLGVVVAHRSSLDAGSSYSG